MLYSGLTNIRDCIAFPKTAKGTDLMTGAPGPSRPASSRNCTSGRSGTESSSQRLGRPDAGKMSGIRGSRRRFDWGPCN